MSKLLSNKGIKDVEDQVFIVLGHFALMAFGIASIRYGIFQMLSKMLRYTG